MLVNFVDFEKAFDSLDRECLWRLLEHYGISPKYINIIKQSYEGTTSRVLHRGEPSQPFEIRSGVKQGCLLSPFLFLLAIDWVMKQTTQDHRDDIQWTLMQQLDDLDFADDLALLSHSRQQMQRKRLEKAAAQLGLRINRQKTKLMKINTQSMEPVELEAGAIEEVNSFTYLGSIVDQQGGSEEDIRVRIGKARTAFKLLHRVWKSREIKEKTKVRIFNSNVKSVLLYGAETWKTTVVLSRRIQSFVNGCLRKILGIRWPKKISNHELWQHTVNYPQPWKSERENGVGLATP